MPLAFDGILISRPSHDYSVRQSNYLSRGIGASPGGVEWVRNRHRERQEKPVREQTRGRK
jgi:hypothetical protein